MNKKCKQSSVSIKFISLQLIYEDGDAPSWINVGSYLSEDLHKRYSMTEMARMRKEAIPDVFSGRYEASRTVEVRDPYTAGHQHRVANLAAAIAEEIGMSEYSIKGLSLAADIHDLGKISVPAEILNKPMRLNDFEFELIKMHSKTGYELLKEIDFPWPIAEMVYQHHERMDGSGYPRGLKGDEILLEARVICVADVVEAMSSHRPYRVGLGIDAALAEIESNKGLLYDTVVVDACLCLFREKGYTLEASQ